MNNFDASTTQTIKLFDRKFHANTLRNKERCLKCRAEFSHNYDKPLGEVHVKSNRPFLLPCGHNMCENCVYHHHRNLTCSVCLSPIEVPLSLLKQYSNFHVRDFFDLNFFLLGELLDLRFYRRDGAANNSVSFGGANKNSQSSVPVVEISTIKCIECEQAPALGTCRTCKACYCSFCFETVHMHSKVLKTHKLSSFAKQGDVDKKLRMPKASTCRYHRKVCDIYCRKCRLICCGVCAKKDHGHHGYHSLFDENQRIKDDLLTVLETVKTSREHLRTAQQDVKSVEMQLEEYATQTLEDISSFFLQIHSVLQNEERRIREKFHSVCLQPQQQIRDACSKLSETQNVLNTMRSNLEFYSQKSPFDIHLRDVVNVCNQQLEHLQCQAQITRLTKNPFIFEELRDLRKEIPKSFRTSYIDPKLAIRLVPMFGDVNRLYHEASFMNMSLSSAQSYKPRNKSKNKQSPAVCTVSQLNSTQSTSTVTSNYSLNFEATTSTHDLVAAEPPQPIVGNVKHNSLVQVSHVKSPEYFYVQMLSAMSKVHHVSQNYELSGLPKSICVGKCYMAYHDSDKQWYRGMLKKMLPKDVYKMFLVDYGITLDVAKEKLGDVDDKYLDIPFAAIRCAIHDIMPAKKGWTDEANNLLIEISRNKPMKLSIFEQLTESIYKVDLFTTHVDPISVRNSFLYTGLAREKPGVSNSMSALMKLSPVARMNQRLFKHILQKGEMLNVQVSHIEDPQKFYVIKIDQLEAKKKLWTDLNYKYGTANASSLLNLYYAPLQMCCAVRVRDVWHRAAVEEVQESGKILVRLVDEGNLEVVHWRQLYVLYAKFRHAREFAIKCALADIEPLQKNNYAWTDKAIKEFKQLAANPAMQIDVCLARKGDYMVALHMAKKHADINVGAMLVKYGHCLSTGEASTILEILKTPKKRMGLPSSAAAQNALTESAKHAHETQGSDGTEAGVANSQKSGAMKVFKRAPIVITHVVHPGEFYIRLGSLEVGTKNFNLQIQQSMQQIFDESANLVQLQDQKEWFVGDHCFVHTKYRAATYTGAANADDYEEYELYRGIIDSITYDDDPELPFVVFLRDIGATLRSIGRSQLYTIARTWDRVANIASRCHLACVEPTGGLPTWSHSAIDFFKHTVDTFSELSATQQGNRDATTNSMPIVLWGTTIETADPLAPCISKYTSINRMIVEAGLAHLVERLDITRQMDQLIHTELAADEITLEDWFKNIADNAMLKAIERSAEKASFQSVGSVAQVSPVLDVHFSFDLHLSDVDDEPITAGITVPDAWLHHRDIGKSIFVAYPTYVDFDCTIYLHAEDDRELLLKMREKITKTYGQLPSSSDVEMVYTHGQPCVVMYHVDKHYYRGIVQELTDNGEYNVIFIDYGNVESCQPQLMRPYAPFPNLPRIASKYRIDGIRPKNNAKAYDMETLDQVHKALVEKLVQVRVPYAELGNEVKLCSMSVDALDVAKMLIAEGLVDRAHRSWSTQPRGQRTYGNRGRSVNMPPVSTKVNCDDEDFYVLAEETVLRLQSPDTHDEKRRPDKVTASLKKKRTHAANRVEDDVDVKICSSDDSADEAQALDNCLEDILQRIDDASSNDNDDDMQQDTFLPPPPPPKKRMFNPHEYQRMAQQLQDENLCAVDNFEDDGVVCDEFDMGGMALSEACAFGIEDEDQDMEDLMQSFAKNYWHDAAGDAPEEEEEENEPKHVKQQQQQDLECSEFDKFHPNDTSSMFSHHSGIENFKQPQLPGGIRHFNCVVVSIVTPTILQIFPNLAEFRYRDMEMQRRIKHLIKSALPLTSYEPRTMCLACYSKDKKWYRALIRSYNPVAKQAEITYVDYLNSESLPVKQLRQYPSELLNCPLRNFRMRLHGVQPNPRMRSKDVIQALQNLICKRVLYARVKKEACKMSSNSADHFFSGNSGASSLIEVALYDSSSSSSACPIYEPLIQQNFYNRI